MLRRPHPRKLVTRVISSLQGAAQLGLAAAIGLGLWGCSGDTDQEPVPAEDAGTDTQPLIEGGPDVMFDGACDCGAPTIEGGPDVMLEGGPDVMDEGGPDSDVD